MASPDKSEPESMEDILASIRKIIAEDPPRKTASALASDATAASVPGAEASAAASARALSLGTTLPRAGTAGDMKALFRPPSARDVLFRRPPEPAKPVVSDPAAGEPAAREPVIDSRAVDEPAAKPDDKPDDKPGDKPVEAKKEPVAPAPLEELVTPPVDAAAPTAKGPAAEEPAPVDAADTDTPATKAVDADSVDEIADRPPPAVFTRAQPQSPLADLLEDFDITEALANGKGAAHEPPDEPADEPEAMAEKPSIEPEIFATEDAATADTATEIASKIDRERDQETVAEKSSGSPPQAASESDADATMDIAATIEPPLKPMMSFAEAVDAILKPAAALPQVPSRFELPPIDETETQFGGRLLDEPAPETTHVLPSALARAIAGDDDFLEMPAWAAALRSDQPQADEPEFDASREKTSGAADDFPRAAAAGSKGSPDKTTAAATPPLLDPGTGELASAIVRVASSITPDEELYGSLKAGDLSDDRLASALSRLAGDPDTAAASTTALKELAAGLAASANREAANHAVPPIPPLPAAALPASTSDFLRTSAPKLDPPKFEAPKPDFTRPEFVKPDALRPPPPPVPVSSVAPEAVFEDTVSKLLKPMLQQWLAENMPRIIENALRAEVGETLAKNSGKPRV